MGQFIRIDFEFLDTLSKLDNTLISSEDEVIGWDNIDYAGGSIFIKQFEALIGDINLNGMPFEVGDAVYFTNYFIDPFNYPLDGDRWPNSDINQDNRPGTIGDLILLQNIVGTGGGSKRAPGNRRGNVDVAVSTCPMGSGTDIAADCSVPIGGALFIASLSGNSQVEVMLTDPGMDADLHWAIHGKQMRILVLARDGRGVVTDGTPIVAVAHSEDLDVTLDEAHFADTYGMLLDPKFGGSGELPESFALGQNYPNPFNPSTTIVLSLPESGHVSVNVFNIKGQLVRTLVDEYMTAGHHEVIWDGRDRSEREAASGIYFYKLETRNYKETKKMTLIK